jgi:hypothetical protein
MAIHPDFPGLKAEVIVNGAPLKEYDDDEKPQPKMLTKYVEVSSNDCFWVEYTVPKKSL